MDEFRQWLIFEMLFIIAAITIWLFAAGKIKTASTQTDSFKEWQQRNGGVVRFVCILIIIVSIGIIVYKYYQIQATLDRAPTLQTD